MDGALDPARREEVAAILREDACLAARMAADYADRDALREALTGILTRPLPPEWRARIEGATRERARGRLVLNRRQAVAAGLAMIAAAGTGAALLRPARDGILQDALAAREAGLGVALPTDAANSAGQNAQLAAVLGLNVRTPDLRHFGFHFARLEVSGQQTAQM